MPDPKDDPNAQGDEANSPVGEDNALTESNEQNAGEGAEGTPNPDDKNPEDVKPSDVA